MANNTIKVSKNTKTNSVSVNKNSAEYQKRMQELNDEEGKRAQARAQKNIAQARSDYESIKNIKNLPKAQQNQRRAKQNLSLVSSDDMNELTSLRKQRNQSVGDQALYDFDSTNDSYKKAYKKVANSHNFSDEDMTHMMDSYDAKKSDIEGIQYAEQARKYAKEHPFLGSLKSLGNNAVSSATAIPQLGVDLINGLRGKETSTHGGTHAFGTAKEKAREEVTDSIDSKLGKGAYNVGMGLGDMAVASLMSAATGGTVSPAVFMGATTGESAQRNAKERGVDTTKATLYGLGSGTIDYALNKVGLDNVLKQSSGGTAKEIVKNMGKGALSEGTANAAQEALQFGLDRLVNGENSDYKNAYDSVYNSVYQKAYEENIAKGMDMTKAERRARQTANSEADKYAKDIRNQRIAEGFGTGALFGAGMSGARGIGKNVSDTIKANRQARIDAPNIEYANALMQMIEGKTDDSNRAFSDTATPEDMLLLQQLGYNIPNSELPQSIPDADTINSTDNASKPVKAETIPTLESKPVSNTPKPSATDGDKISRMTKKTIPSQVTEEEYNSRYGGDSSFKYDNVDEETSMKWASDYLNSRSIEQAETELLDASRKYSSQDVDALMQLNQKFIEQARSATDKTSKDALWNRSFELMKRLRSESTNNAQALQALAKWSRNTPEGMLAWAMSKAEQANKTASVKVLSSVEKAFKSSTTIDEAVNKILKMDLQLFAKNGGAQELLDYIEKNYKGVNKNGTVSKTKYRDVTSKEMASLGKKAVSIIEKNVDKSSLDSSQAKQMYDLFEDANNYPSDSREWNTRMASAMKILDESMPSSVSKKARTVIYDNMLASLRTMVTRNLGGNVVYNALELASKPAKVMSDVVASAVTKNRTQKLSANALSEGTKGFKKGISDMKLDLQEGTKTTRSGFKSLDDIYSSVEKTFKTQSNNKGVKTLNKVLDTYDKIIRTGLELGDRPIYEAAYNANKAELNEIVSTYGEDGLRTGIENGSSLDIDDIIESLSVNAGLDAVMQNNSGMKQAMIKLKQSLGDISKDATGGFDVLSIANSPFVEVPGNMLSRYLQYTPFGLVGNIGRSIGEVKNYGGVNQRRMTTELGRNLTGTALSLLGTSLGAKGMISDPYSDDPEERKAQQNNGYLEYAFTNPINGRQYDISDIPVVGSKLIEGRILADAYQDAVDTGDNEKVAWLKALIPSLQGGLGDTLFQGINRITGADTQYGSGGVVDNILNNTKSFASSALVPSFVRQTAQFTDDYKRDLGDYATDEYYKNSLKNSLPGEFFGFGRQTLDPKINTAGEEVYEDQGRTGLQRFWDTYLAPYKSSDYQDVMPLLNQEATDLKELTNGEYNPQLPLLKQNDLKGTKGYDAEMYTHQDLYDAQSEFYSRNSAAGTELLNSSFYKSLSPEDKSEVLADLYEASKAATKENIARKGKSDKAIADGLAKDELYVTKNKVTPYLKDGDYNGAIKQLEKQYYFKKYNVSNSKAAEEEYSKGIQNFINWATTRAKNTQAAEDYGYLKSDGSANLKGYEKANEFFEGDTRYIQSYAKSNEAMENATNKKLSDGLKYAIPYLYTDNAMSDEEKGMYITLANKGSLDDLPKKAKEAYNNGGYAGVYQYYLKDTLFKLDKNKDGVISQEEFNKKYDPEKTDSDYLTYLSAFYGMRY